MQHEETEFMTSAVNQHTCRKGKHEPHLVQGHSTRTCDIQSHCAACRQNKGENDVNQNTNWRHHFCNHWLGLWGKWNVSRVEAMLHLLRCSHLFSWLDLSNWYHSSSQLQPEQRSNQPKRNTPVWKLLLYLSIYIIVSYNLQISVAKMH